MSNIIVIGGGASGMMAAITARRRGKQVLLLERNGRLGKKLLATGNGRCNYTNKFFTIDNFHGENPMFPISVLSQFNFDMTLEFFNGLGILPSVEASGKVFPYSYQSQSILDVLVHEMESLGVAVKTNSFVKKFEKKGNKFKVYTEDKVYSCSQLIVCGGGVALPSSGSDGNAFFLAKEHGHRVTRFYPGLVQLKLEGEEYRPMSGVKFDGSVGLFVDGKLIKKDRGDLLFTDYGISGPPILQLSREANKALEEGRDPYISLSLFHDKSFEEVRDYLYYRFGLIEGKTAYRAMIGLVHEKQIGPILKRANIEEDRRLSEISSAEIESLARLLINWDFKVRGSKDFKFAQVTVGGIDTKDVDNISLESKLVEGLYFAGEVLDVDGDCGGFNLQWAWSSGYVAGLNASK